MLNILDSYITTPLFKKHQFFFLLLLCLFLPNQQLSSRITRPFCNIFPLQNHCLSLINFLKLAPQDSKTKIIPSTAANSLKAAIFHTIAFKLSPELNNDQIIYLTKRSFLKVVYNVCKIKNQKKRI